MSRPSVKLRQGPLGPEKRCSRCEAWLPATKDHFYSAPREPGGLFYCCKTCYLEFRATRKEAKAAMAADGGDDFDLPVVHRVVDARHAEPLGVALLAHGWIPPLEGVRLADPAREPIAAQPLVGVNWRRSSPPPPDRDRPMRDAVLAHLQALPRDTMVSGAHVMSALDTDTDVDALLEELFSDGLVAREHGRLGVRWGLWHPTLRDLGAPVPVTGDADALEAPAPRERAPVRGDAARYSRKGRSLVAFFDRVLGAPA